MVIYNEKGFIEIDDVRRIFNGHNNFYTFFI